MTDITEWQGIFEQPDIPEAFYNDLHSDSVGNTIQHKYREVSPDFTGVNIVIIGVGEDRNAKGNYGTSKAPDKIREELYKLMHRTSSLTIADIGNIKPGQTVQDTYSVLSGILAEFIINKIFPIIIGGSNDVAYANYLAYENLEQIINIVSIDSLFDVGQPGEEINSQTFLNQIILREPNYLFNFINIGYQTYFIPQDVSDLIEQLLFDAYRVGVIREDIEEAEPLLRSADMLIVDISAVRSSDATGNEHSSPNGFYGEEICKLCRYAGMSDKLSSAGIYEINPLLDIKNQTSKLAAQMIWFLIEGISLRKNDNPRNNDGNYSKYHVFSKKFDSEIVFYKSKKTGRWWMEVPTTVQAKEKFKRHYIVPCSQKDYKIAVNDDIPDRMIKTYQKIM